MIIIKCIRMAATLILLIFISTYSFAEVLGAGEENALEGETLNGLPIASISVNNMDVFKEDDGYLYRKANNLHVKTQKNILISQLLFKVGDPYSERLAEESERILRSNRFIRDAIINAKKTSDGQVKIQILTFDTWSTKPSLSFGRIGGKNKSKIGLEEANFLGLGKEVGLYYKDDVDRSYSTFRYKDKNLMNSWNQLHIEYSNTSDGYSEAYALSKPFYSMDSRDSFEISFNNDKREESLYFLSSPYLTWENSISSAEISKGFSKGLLNDKVLRHRYGVGYFSQTSNQTEGQPIVTDDEISQYIASLPESIDIDYMYPFYELEYLENSFDKTVNFNKISRTEDRYLGTRASLRIGYLNSAYEDNADYLKLKGALIWNAQLNPYVFLSASGAFTVDAPLQSGSDYHELSAEYSAKFYISESENLKFYADVSGVNIKHARIGDQLFLDEEVGLRGYPLRNLSGDAIHKITFEQRYFASKEYFNLFNIGCAAFFDVGNVSGLTDFEKEISGTYKSIGFGLRFTSNRSSQGDIIHLDFAKPLDPVSEEYSGWQFSLRTKQAF